MVRTQIQLTPEQAAILHVMSAERHLPIAELIRMSIDAFVSREAGIGLERKRMRAASVVGRFASQVTAPVVLQPTDVSAEHDRYLAEAFRQP